MSVFCNVFNVFSSSNSNSLRARASLEDSPNWLEDAISDKTFFWDFGILAFEIGHDQGLDVRILMEEAGFSNVKLVKDLAGLDRVLLGYFKCW